MLARLNPTVYNNQNSGLLELLLAAELCQPATLDRVYVNPFELHHLFLLRRC